MKKTIAVIVLLIAAGCSSSDGSSNPKQTGIANPASVKCINDGYKLEIRTAPDGGQYGVCIDADGKECEEWAYFRGECQLGKKNN